MRLRQTLALLRGFPGMDPTQALAFLLNVYLMEMDQLRARGGKQRSQLDQVAWKPFGPLQARPTDLVAMTRNPLWSLETLLTLFWARPEHYVHCLVLGEQDDSRRLEWRSIPPGIFAPAPHGQLAAPVAHDPAPAGSTVPADVPPALLALQAAAQEQDPASLFGHTDDYRQVTLRGETFQLTINQAAVVRWAHTARWRDPPEVSLAEICEEENIYSRRLGDIFKHNKAARHALLRQGSKRGSIRLNN